MKDNILELGCGRGVGAMAIAKQYRPQNLTGIDITKEQIDIANFIHSNKLRNKYQVKFLNYGLEDLAATEVKFNKCYSVEVFQHISDIGDTLDLLKKVLLPNSVVVIATYFLKKALLPDDILSKFPLAKTKQEFWITIDAVEQIFKEKNFNKIQKSAIGSEVFFGYHVWNQQQCIDTDCSYVYYNSYLDEIIDYYVITAVT